MKKQDVFFLKKKLPHTANAGSTSCNFSKIKIVRSASCALLR